MMLLPDDVACELLAAAQAGGPFRVIPLVDAEDDDSTVDALICETKKTPQLRALACVSTQFRNLHRQVLRLVGRRNWRLAAPNGGAEQTVVFIEFVN